MITYEKLLIEADNKGIEILELDLGTCKKCGKCIDSTIIINANLPDIEKFEVLAEELGHYHTTIGDITDQDKIENRKQENKARRWGYKHTVSLVGIIDAYEYGAKNSYELSDFLGVTEEYLSKSIREYRRIYGIGYRLGQYYIRFEPTLGVYKSFYPVFKCS